MTRRFTFAFVLACLLGTTGALALQQVFRGGTDLVRVFVTVTDKDGRLVPNLTQNDFVVRDEGKPQPITVFDNTPQPIRLVVMLDVSGSMTGSLGLLRGGPDQLFARMQSSDLARVGLFGHEVWISPAFTNNIEELRGALPTTIAHDAPTPLWRAVDQAMGTFKSDDPERRVVLVLSDGKDSGPAQFNQRWISQGDVIDRARKEEVMVYGIGLRSSGNRNLGLGPGGLSAALAADLPDPGLATVALQTGGGYAEVRLGQDLAAAFARVADELHSQYLLGYDPPKKDGKSHKIEVQVSQRGMTPRARKSYIAEKD